MALPTRFSRLPLRQLRQPARHLYHSSAYPQTPPYNSAEASILSSALRHVPEYGFTQTALRLGARDAGYRDVSTNLFPREEFELVRFHLVTKRLGLAESVQFPAEGPEGGRRIGVGEKVRSLLLARLWANKEVIGRWQEALAIMAQPSYALESLRELARLADEIWFLAGDTSVDTTWYTKRASVSAIYSATELFMTQDRSPNFKDTEEFLDHRMDEVKKLGSAVQSVGEWLEFQGHATVNLLRSKGMRI